MAWGGINAPLTSCVFETKRQKPKQLINCAAVKKEKKGVGFEIILS
jgi:hypothetical protein